jgi:hypothetical protein
MAESTSNDGASDDSESVAEWAKSFRSFWRTDGPPPEWKAALERFSSFCEATPDEIIDEVLRPQPTGEGLRLRTRARRKYIRLIEEFEEQENRSTANGVRSFMIHNGVAMTPTILR